jgi:2-C-methyl-D-erythritol 4-phosphate cytidylyltransferase
VPVTAGRSRMEPVTGQRLRSVALVPAAGLGLRMGGPVRKQFLEFAGLPLLVHSLRVLQSSPVIDQIVLAVPEADLSYCRSEIVETYGFSKVVNVVAGGQERQDSVRRALAVVDERIDIVVIHDAVRPCVTDTMLRQVVEAAMADGAAIIALPMRDTVKQVGGNRFIERTIDRKPLWLAQTPQAFRRDWLQEAHRKAHAEGLVATDDAYLLEWMGRPVRVVEGSGENIKVTRPEDLAIGEAILASRLNQKS